MARRKPTAAKVHKAIEPMTISEFRAKLEGIEMFQPEDWSPDADQWRLIREMINKVVEEVVEVEKPVMMAQPPSMLPPNPKPGGSSGLDMTPPPPMPVATSSTGMTPEQLANLPLSELKKLQEAKTAGATAGGTKTPAVDTSTRPYSVKDSPFA